MGASLWDIINGGLGVATNRNSRSSLNPLDVLRGGLQTAGRATGAFGGTRPSAGQGSFQSSGRSLNEIMHPSGGRAGAQLGLPKPGSIEEILAELQRLQDPNRYAMDPAMLSRQAMAAASAQYDPISSALRGQASAAQQRAGRNRQQLGSMYGGLSQSLMADVAPIQQQFADTQAKTGQQYQQLQDQIKQQYSSSQAEQEAMMKRLNIEAAAPQALAGQQSDQNFAVTQAAQQGQNVQDQLSQQGAGAVTYTRQGSELARTEGTNRQADLMAQLSDYLQQVQGQMGANEAAKAAAYQSNLMGLQQDASKSAVSNAQRDFENYAKTIGIMQSLQSKGQVGAVKSPIDVGPRVMGTMGLDANTAQQIQSAFMTAVSSDPLVLTGVDPSSTMGLTKEALAKRVVEVGRSRGLSQPALNALQEVALEYFGRQ